MLNAMNDGLPFYLEGLSSSVCVLVQLFTEYQNTHSTIRLVLMTSKNCLRV